MHNRFLVLPVAAALALGACSSDTTGPSGNAGRLTIQLTDSPGEVAGAFITIDHITLIGTTTDGQSKTLTFQPAQSGFINLLDLAGGQVLNVVNGAEVPAGQYTEMRLYLDDAYVRLADGRVLATSGATLPGGVTSAGELKCPSCSQSGYKVKFMNGGLTIDADETTTVLLDFDVGQSFVHQAGQSGMWIMSPVLRATTNAVSFGKLTGTVALAQGVTLGTCGGAAVNLASFAPVLTLNGDTYTGTVTTAGALTFATLVPGLYVLPTTGQIRFINGDVLNLVLTPNPTSITITDWGTTVNSFTYTVTSATCVPHT